ncbi:cation transporter [Sulfitobacter sp. HI0082]|nr:cation transporter [Sulfitobacter sp. HI0082]
MKSVTLKIAGLRCHGCAENVKALISAEPGVRGASVSHAEGEARILYDPQAIDEKQFVEIIERAGYRVPAQAA